MTMAKAMVMALAVAAAMVRAMAMARAIAMALAKATAMAQAMDLVKVSALLMALVKANTYTAPFLTVDGGRGRTTELFTKGINVFRFVTVK
jgi:hypothetical protein